MADKASSSDNTVIGPDFDPIEPPLISDDDLSDQQLTEASAGSSVSGDQSVLDQNDHDLINNTRQGSIAAAEELWQRHSVFGLVVAGAETDPEQAEAVNDQAWANIISGLATGQTPPAAFRPYLYNQVHSSAITLTDTDAAPNTPSARMAAALESLPTRWQEVLWYLDVEQMTVDDVALLTGMSTTAIPEVRSRARRGLKDAWLKVNADAATQDSNCQWAREHARAWLNKTLPPHDSEVMTAHLKTCHACRNIIGTATHMASSVRPLLLAGVCSAAGGLALQEYLDANGAVVINESALPPVALAAFSAERAGQASNL
ncbi:MAG: zf-HC2 domain-containing protein, partial [Propionibacteriaceae bacterium]|nr:zf-HC2 domain-containing protein [Propionibacteriaceae bacterium]